MQTWRQRYLHSGFGPDEDDLLVARGHALAIACLAVALMGAAIALFQASVGAWPMVAVFGVLGLVALALPVAQRDHVTLERSGHLLLGLAFVELVAATLVRGGLSSPLPVAFAMLPGFSTYLLRAQRGVWGWTGVAVATLVGMAVVPERLGVELFDRIPASARATVDLLIPLGMLALITGLSRARARALDSAMAAERQRFQSDQAGKLERAEQMAIVGRLAVGVAHEVNNPLAYIGANIDYTTKRMRKDDPQRWKEEIAALRDASDGVHRIAEVVAQLDAHGRQDEETIRPVRVREALEIALSITRNQLRHRARVFRQYTHHPVVLADPTRLTQVFLNILSNSAQALPAGKRNDNEIRIELRTEDDAALIEIADTGRGMDPEVLPRVTEPFFTTQQVSHGAGLGLSISESIVRSYGGTLQLWSRPGEGTRAQIRLPITDEEPVTLRDEEPAELNLAVPTHQPRLLLIDDDATVRRSLARVLPGQVTQAGHAQDALDAIETDPSFDVIVCDVMMPDMTGIDFYRALSARNPELCSRVMFLTGGVFESTAEAFIREHGIPVLNKPVRRHELVTAVEEMMNPADGARRYQPSEPDDGRAQGAGGRS